MKIAIVGAGIAGLASAWMLEDQHQVTVYEASQHLGGHARTLEVPWSGGVGLAETGFRFVVRASYPHVVGLFDLLGVEVREVRRSMTFLRPGRQPLVLPPRNLDQLRRVIGSPSTAANLLQLRRLVGRGPAFLASDDRSTTVSEFCRRERCDREFVERLLLPMLAGSWGASRAQMAEFPIYNIFRVFAGDTTIVIEGGASAYIAKLVGQIRRALVHRGRAVRSLRRADHGGIWVGDQHGDDQHYDAVVLATESTHAVTLASGVDPARARLLSEFEWFPTMIVVHTDPSVMPPRKSDWSMVNVVLPAEPEQEPWNTACWGWEAQVPVFRTWVTGHARHPRGVVYEQSFRHQLVTAGTPALRARLLARQGKAGLWVAGMYAGEVDNHEGALGSAITLVEKLAPTSERLAALREAGRARRAPIR